MKKTMKNWLAVSLCFLILVVSIVFYLNNRPDDNAVRERSITMTDVGFDTSITFKATCSKEDFDKYTKIVRKMYKHYNKLYDAYNSYKGVNNVYTLNQEAYDHAVEVDPDLTDCIELGLQMNETCSQFDITQGDIMSIWHTYREEGIQLNDEGKSGKLPDDAQLQEALTHAGSDKVIIEGNTIRFTDPELKLDLGGIAKGYTSQLVKEELNKRGLKNGFINAGGNVVILGAKSDGSDWKIGIQNPDGNTALITYETDSDDAIVTSGDYQRYYKVGKKKYSHIIDFTTGYPANYCRSVTVVCSDSGKADALSTALYCLNYEDGKKLAEKEKIGAVWIFTKSQAPDDSPDLKSDGFYIYATDNMKDKISVSY
ncbi:FAD:protein FMN transferase [Catenisphaera adipataccumulans]|jgi:thiamine biosynthesis lipoprotein|uniref:FAD:protein FMN transferase n=1 Tax=Catenisphaera adipataccumulans TaxID=700500 RepID=A0A7W8CX76_9FIRM|nr:FAD:protein FMN transferase [Catenisphaera adipataccumulans]MBB5183253.1 thiamine biosynthesis lipoprotein [Catenisphaera adipataccumulans]